ncbi:UNC-like C-terminal-domain-containing protein [Glomus cerebriforme]|uniref:UNC-like C-terminal-domain-containing protein n=1 Tax=Glomus cerebriforme TaxID=658196 RepID=A0A397TL41_9GLOM|nr:UNC-like C-terminal-domain-containing protein [Glomus cerebriforme]
MSPITRSKTSLIRWRYPDFPTFQDLEKAFKIAYPKIQDDAKQLLEMMIEESEIREYYYNPTSPEYWIINNEEALEEVVYYKMKKRLILRHKTQLIEKGVDLSEYSDTESEFGGEPPPTIEDLLNKEGISNEVQDELMAESSSSTNSPTTTSFREFISMKKDEESNTRVLMNDYVNNLHRDLRSINFQSPINRIMNLTIQEIIFYLFILFLIITYFIMNPHEYINTQRQKNLIKGKLHGTVKAQVKEFIDQEISRVSKGLMENTEEDNDFIGFVRTQLNEVFQEQLEIFMDGSTSADFALHTGGARIIHQLTSRNYELWPSKSYQKLLGRVTNNIIKSKNPETVISPNVNVGECWCFNGTKGQIAIKLSRSIILTHITYHHISREVSIDPILSAPKEFELWGLPTTTTTSTSNEVKGEIELEKNSLGIFGNDFKYFLGRYQYDINGLPTQTFSLPDSIENKRISAIMMKVLSNHENPQFTCLYRLQVHGVMPK